MQIQYYLADGQEIVYTCSSDIPTIADIDTLALMYAQKRTKDLPDSVFMNVRLYSDFIRSFYGGAGMVHNDKYTGQSCLQISTSAGVLKVIPLPYASDAKMLLVGKREDFDRYDIDKIFEEVVLKDCETE